MGLKMEVNWAKSSHGRNHKGLVVATTQKYVTQFMQENGLWSRPRRECCYSVDAGELYGRDHTECFQGRDHIECWLKIVFCGRDHAASLLKILFCGCEHGRDHTEALLHSLLYI